MPDLLFELGCEELPAAFVRDAAAQLHSQILQRLVESGLSHGDTASFCTPRRLIISVTQIPERQPDQSKESRGPSLAAAYGMDGSPTKALIGFCRGQGVDPSDVRKDDEYVWATKTTPGQDALNLLSAILPASVRAMTFAKSMRWGSTRMRFARPIRWLLATYNGSLVEFDIEGVKSGMLSRGHRFNYPEPFLATTIDDLLRELRSRNVEPDPALRRETIISQSMKVSSGQVDLVEELVDENVFLTEWPSALVGEFKSEYLALPEPVLVMAMAKHEKYFPIRNSDGKLTNRFVSIRNGGEDDVVRTGNEWVLNARFNDAKFFFDEDAKKNIDFFLDRTATIVFQERLGSVRERADRLELLTAEVAMATGAGEEEVALARQSGLYAKFDLSTGLVSELPALQGLIGSAYASREGLPEAVCFAIESQYSPSKIPSPEVQKSRTALRLVVADQLEKLVAFLSIGIAPTGTNDPFALRRCGTQLIEVAWLWSEARFDYSNLIGQAYRLQRNPSRSLPDVIESVEQVFKSRYTALIDSEKIEILEAVTRSGVLNPCELRFRLAILNTLARDANLVQTATRPVNIVSAAEKKGVLIPGELPVPGDIKSAEGEALMTAYHTFEQGVDRAFMDQDVSRAIEAIKDISDPINTFFDSTMVMVDDQSVRSARLALLKKVSEQVLRIGDLT